MAFQQYQKPDTKRYHGIIPKEILNQMPPYEEVISNIKGSLIYFKLGPYEYGYIYGIAYDEKKQSVYCVTKNNRGEMTAKWFTIEELSEYQNELGARLSLDDIIKHPYLYSYEFNPEWLEDPYVLYLVKNLIQ